MRIAFAYIDPSYETMGPFHMGLASLIACLRQGGHDCRFIHIMRDVPDEDFIDFLQRNRPDVVAFSVITNTLPRIGPAAALVKRHTDALTICGGAHAMLYPEEVIAIDGIDMVGVGEGEGVLLDMCNRLDEGSDISDIPNLWLKRDGKVIRNPIRPLIEDLDALPFPDREVFSFAESFDLQFMKRGVFMASRGCPYNCSYCCSPAMKQMYGGKKYIRFRSVENLIEEVERVTVDFPNIEYNVFHDDLLPMKKEWFADFTREYSRRVRKPFEMNCHPNLMDRDIALMAKSAGCSLIRFGIESGNEGVRRNVLDRHVTDKHITDAFRCCDEAEIDTLSYNMIGLPHETPRQVLDTIKLNGRVSPKVMHVSIFYPFPGTRAYEVCKREGLLTDKSTDSYYEDSVLDQESISPEQLRALNERFEPFARRYSQCYNIDGIAGKLGERLIDACIMSTTNSRLLKLRNKLSRGKRKDGSGSYDGTCYIIGREGVQVWEKQ
ncbi:MAG: radical SAM protein [Chloroflexota bacterium]|nr:radical SAM protein [Chloroflexota bacterium]